jgi:hypothetical protein
MRFVDTDAQPFWPPDEAAVKVEGQAEDKVVGQLDPAWLTVGCMTQTDCGPQ